MAGRASRQGGAGFALGVLLATAAAALVGAAAIVAWLVSTEVEGVALRLPSDESAVSQRPAATDATARNQGTLLPGFGEPSKLPGSWPQFRGADRSNVAREVTGLARSWPPSGPQVLWKIDVGEGYAAPAIHNGRVYIIDYDKKQREDAIRCLSLDDAGELWRYTYYVKVKRNHGMSRTVPAVNGRFVVTLGPMCHVNCLDAKTGERVWKMDLVKDYGTEVPDWYAGQCPLIDGDAVILAPGGEPLMMAVELATGKIRWRTRNPGRWAMTHSSIVPFDFAAGRQYVYCASKGVVGVCAKTGEILWTKPDWTVPSSNMPAPVVIDSERIFLSGGYESGCVMIRVKTNGQRLETEELFRLDDTVFDSPQQTPIFYKKHLYGVIGLGGDDRRSQLACLDLNGKRLWTSGAENRFGLGAYMLAGGMLFVLQGAKGTLHLVEATPRGYNELARAQVLDGHEAWGPIAMAGSRIIVRDLTHMVCLQLPKAQ